MALPRLLVGGSPWIGGARATIASLGEALATSGRLQQTVTVKTSQDRWFMYNESQTKNPSILPDTLDPTITMTAKEMLERVQQPALNKFLYFTCPLDELWPELSTYWSPALQMGPKFSSVWIASRRSGTRAHYDALDNTFVMTDGFKRLRVWAPDQHLALHVFPDAHPRARKSQVDPDHPELSRFPNYRDLSEPLLDVELGPGDAVEIPAFFFHELETLSETSVSINLFRPSPVASLAAQTFALPLCPDLEAQSLPRLIADLINIAGLSPDFSQQLLASRFKSLENIEWSSSTSLSSQKDKTKLVTASSNGIKLERWRDALQNVSLAYVDKEHIARGIKELVVAHLTELWIISVTGQAQHIPGILKTSSEVSERKYSDSETVAQS